jgi:hypothetical protein
MAQLVSEQMDHIGVELNRDHLAGGFGQAAGQRAGTGADLQDRILVRDPGRFDNFGQVEWIGQKVLGQAAPGL